MLTGRESPTNGETVIQFTKVPKPPSVKSLEFDEKSLQSVGKWFAEKWAKLEQRYGRRAALGMAVAAVATMPIPFNVTAIIGVAETIRGIHGYATGKALNVTDPRIEEIANEFYYEDGSPRTRIMKQVQISKVSQKYNVDRETAQQLITAASALHAPVYLPPVEEELKSFPSYLTKDLGPHKFGCLMARPPMELSKQITDWSLKEILDCHLAADGRELTPHVTCVYGFDGDVEERVREYVIRHGPFPMRFDGLDMFEADDHDVLFVKVLSPDLEEMHFQLLEEFGVVDKYPEFKPHLTLAYLAKGVGSYYLGLDPPFAKRECRVEEMEYRGADASGGIIPLSYYQLFGTKDATGKPKGPGFTGKDKLGRQWRNGKLVPKAEQAITAQTAGTPPPQAATAETPKQQNAEQIAPNAAPAEQKPQAKPEVYKLAPEQVAKEVKANDVSTYAFAPEEIEPEKTWQKEYANYLMRNVEAVPQQPPGVAARFISGLLNTALGGAGWLLDAVSQTLKEVWNDPALQEKVGTFKEYVKANLGIKDEDEKEDKEVAKQVDQTTKALMALFAKALPLLEGVLKELAAQKKAQQPKNEIPEAPKPKTPEPIKHPEATKQPEQTKPSESQKPTQKPAEAQTAAPPKKPKDELGFGDLFGSLGNLATTRSYVGHLKEQRDAGKTTDASGQTSPILQADQMLKKEGVKIPDSDWEEFGLEGADIIAKYNGKPEFQDKMRAYMTQWYNKYKQPEPKKANPTPPSPSKSDLRANPDLDAVFSEEPEKEEPKPKKPLRHNPDLDEAFKRLPLTKFKVMSAMNTLTGGALVPPPAQGRVIKPLRNRYKKRKTS